MSSADGINAVALRRVVETYVSEETDVQKLEFLWQGVVFALGSEEDRRILSEGGGRDAPANSESVLSRKVATGPIPKLDFPEEDKYLGKHMPGNSAKKRRGGQLYTDKSKQSPNHDSLERGTYSFSLTYAEIEDLIEKYGFNEEARTITSQHAAYLNMTTEDLWTEIFKKAYEIDVSYGVLQDCVAYEEMTLPVVSYEGARTYNERYLRTATWYVWFKTVNA